MFEIGNLTKSSEPKEDDANKEYIKNRITRKISTVLEFLAELYELKQEYKA